MKEYVDLMMNCIKDFKLSSLASFTNFKYPERIKSIITVIIQIKPVARVNQISGAFVTEVFFKFENN